MQRDLFKTIQNKVLLLYFSHMVALNLLPSFETGRMFILSKKYYKDVTYNSFRHESTLNMQVHQKRALLLITDVYCINGNESVYGIFNGIWTL